MELEKLEDIPTHLLKSVLEEDYHISVQVIIQLGGYSNRTFQVKDNNGKEFIARVATPHKTEVQLNNEVHVLTELYKKGYDACPKVVDTINTTKFSYLNFKTKKCPLQVFGFIPGTVKYSWEERCSKADLQSIFTYLPDLHKNMAQIPDKNLKSASEPVPVELLLSTAIEKQPIGAYLAEKDQLFLKKTALLLEIQHAIASNSEHIQWIHGDVHLENLLFLPDNKIAVIDFENAQIAPLELDIVFSAFRIAKIGKDDKQLHYHKEDIHTALEAYAVQNKTFTFLVEQLDEKEHVWKALFCLDQALLYLGQAFKGVWELEEGIGFLACFNEVLAYEE